MCTACAKAHAVGKCARASGPGAGQRAAPLALVIKPTSTAGEVGDLSHESQSTRVVKRSAKEEQTYLSVYTDRNVTAPRPRAPAQHRCTIAMPASVGATQVFSPPTIPIAEIPEPERGVMFGQTGQGGRARLDGASRRGGNCIGSIQPVPIDG
eukprot:6176913-Pleurochrysis_carterae.AAC.7